jgi:hypothetical protein
MSGQEKLLTSNLGEWDDDPPTQTTQDYADNLLDASAHDRRDLPVRRHWPSRSITMPPTLGGEA